MVYHVNVNVNLMGENVTQIQSRIITNTEGSVKNIIYSKKIIFGIPLHVILKMEKYLVNGYLDGIKGNKYLTLVPTIGNKEKIKKYEDYDEKYMMKNI